MYDYYVVFITIKSNSIHFGFVGVGMMRKDTKHSLQRHYVRQSEVKYYYSIHLPQHLSKVRSKTDSSQSINILFFSRLL